MKTVENNNKKKFKTQKNLQKNQTQSQQGS